MVSLTGADWLPAVSTLLATTVLGPGASASDADQLAVPVATWKGPLPSWTSTCATPLLSLAVPCTVTVPLVTRDPSSGEVMATLGLVTSTKLAVSDRLDCITNGKAARVAGTPPLR